MRKNKSEMVAGINKPTEGQIEKWNYGDYSSDNYGSHCQAVRIGLLTLYFSYQTVVAFKVGITRYVCENVWSNTTGKHLNWIDCGYKRGRTEHSKFSSLLEEVLKNHKLFIQGN